MLGQRLMGALDTLGGITRRLATRFRRGLKRETRELGKQRDQALEQLLFDATPLFEPGHRRLMLTPRTLELLLEPFTLAHGSLTLTAQLGFAGHQARLTLAPLYTHEVTVLTQLILALGGLTNALLQRLQARTGLVETDSIHPLLGQLAIIGILKLLALAVILLLECSQLVALLDHLLIESGQPPLVVGGEFKALGLMSLGQLLQRLALLIAQRLL